MAKKTKWTYHKSATVTLLDGSKESFASQLYKISVYIIWNNNPATQGGMEPSGMERLCKRIKKDLDKGVLKSVDWGPEITVTKDESGFYVEVK